VSITWPSGVGAVIAVIVLVLVIVFWAIGQMDPRMAALLGALAVARLT
jgi:uncharacterized membrane protein (DUF485 family)